ncbi:MAG: transcription antitermination factor NusB [Candidatus Omnitrophica bacterium]|nr:transcription antitermination factor NusB [Candidatus Omnitrophota bacterium]
MRKRTLAREFALQILYKRELNPESDDTFLSSFWETNPAPPEVLEYTEKIVRGTLRHLEEIDHLLSKYAEHWELHRMAVIDRNILRFSTYELLYLEDIPPKVVINEAVNIAKKFSQEESGKFVNGILDKINHTEPRRKET